MGVSSFSIQAADSVPALILESAVSGRSHIKIIEDQQCFNSCLPVNLYGLWMIMVV